MNRLQTAWVGLSTIFKIIWHELTYDEESDLQRQLDDWRKQRQQEDRDRETN